MTNQQLLNLLKEMSLEEKILQLVQLNGSFYGEQGTVTGPAHDFNMSAETPWLAGSILGEIGAEYLTDLQDKFIEYSPHRIPSIFMADIIHGCRTIFPVPLGQGASFDPELAQECASAAAKETAASGIHLTFSPMCDLCRDSRWGRVMEGTGEDPYLNSLMAAAMVRGYQGDDFSAKDKVAACVKHFAAYGAATAGKDYAGVELSTRTLLDDYLPAYEAAIKAGAPMVMTAFNTIDRIPCSTNKWLMRKILRDDMSFDGVLISDYAAIKETIAHTSSADKKDAAEKAIKAGVDIDMMTDCYFSSLKDLIAEGAIDEKLVDEACYRVLKLKNDLGLFENPYKGADAELAKRINYCEEHRQLSIKAARESAVLLKNDRVLPLSDDLKVAVVGALSDHPDTVGSWAIFAEKEKTVHFKQAITEAYPNTKVYPYDTPDEEMLDGCKNADVVILCVGETDNKTGEGKSLTDITLCAEHRALFDAVHSVNENTVVLIYSGRPLCIEEINHRASAIMDVFYPGTFGNYGIVELLYGKASPSGRLPMCFPYTTGQLPMSYANFTTGRPVFNWTHYIPFASNYMDKPNVPLYPFGYGLSYTNFEYSPVTLSSDTLTPDGRITVNVTVTNNSNVAGAEPVQLYIKDMKASVIRPDRELKGIKKPYLKAGESVTLGFDITADMLKFHDEYMNFTAEKGDFTVFVGGSSTTQNSARFRLK